MYFNRIRINEVIIDQHYKDKHPEMSDEIILKLVLNLNHVIVTPRKLRDQYLYFTEEPIFYENKPHRMILLTEKHKNYIGVINAFRVQEKKHGISIKKRD